MFVMLTLITARPDERASLLAAAATFARQSIGSEEYCRRLDVLTDETSPDRIVLFAVFDDRDAYEDHVATEHARRFEDACEAHAATRQLMQLMPHPIDGPSAETGGPA